MISDAGQGVRRALIRRPLALLRLRQQYHSLSRTARSLSRNCTVVEPSARCLLGRPFSYLKLLCTAVSLLFSRHDCIVDGSFNVRFLLDGSFNVRFRLNDRAVFCLPQLCFWLSECDVLHLASQFLRRQRHSSCATLHATPLRTLIPPLFNRDSAFLEMQYPCSSGMHTARIGAATMTFLEDGARTVTFLAH